MSDNIPQWAIKEAVLRLDAEHLAQFVDDRHPHMASPDPAKYFPQVRVIARLIAAHEEPPVDPLLIEAREICAAVQEKRGFPIYASQFRDGGFDACHGPMMATAMAALRRGIELAREQSHV